MGELLGEGECLCLGMMYGEYRWTLVGDESSGERGEEREELREEGGADEEAEDVLKAAARKAGL